MQYTQRRFTLVELLTVIAIIAVLMGLLLPTIMGVKTKAKEAQARAEMKSLQTAIAQYESTYGYLPWTTGSGDTLLTSTEFDILIGILQGANTRGVRFLDVVTEQGPGKFADPWENRYIVVLDLDYDGKIAQHSSNGPAEDVYASVAIWSRGKDKENNLGDVKDLVSWK